MSASMIFTGLNSVHCLLNVIENVSPGCNLSLYNRKLVRKLLENKEYQEKIERIEQIKNRVCTHAGIPSENVELRIQRRGIIESHGPARNAVLGISLPLLAQFKVEAKKEKDEFKKFLESLPNDSEKIVKIIKDLPKEDLEILAKLERDNFLNLDEDELEFLISHEILGHIQSNDSVTLGISSTVLGACSMGCAEAANSYLSFPGSTYVWHSIFYGLSRLGLTIVTKQIEKQADQKALVLEKNREGGAKFIKRLLAVELLRKYSSHTPKKVKMWIGENGERLLNLSYEQLSKRLNRCVKCMCL